MKQGMDSASVLQALAQAGLLLISALRGGEEQWPAGQFPRQNQEETARLKARG